MKRAAEDVTRRAADAYEAHAALLRTEAANPSLLKNPFWVIMRQDAYEQFAIAFAGARP